MLSKTQYSVLYFTVGLCVISCCLGLAKRLDSFAFCAHCDVFKSRGGPLNVVISDHFTKNGNSVP